MSLEFSTDDPADEGFSCEVCHAWHSNLPFSYSVKTPFAVTAVPEAELDARVVFSFDQCVIDQREFYLRGRIPIPVRGEDRTFIWGVWARVNAKDFLRTNQLWKVNGRENEPPYHGWLDTKLPLYGETLNLEVLVRTQVVGQRPQFEVVDQSHPLALEQSEGISMWRVRRIAERFLHPDAKQK